MVSQEVASYLESLVTNQILYSDTRPKQRTVKKSVLALVALDRSFITRSGISRTFGFTAVTPFSDPPTMSGVADSSLIQREKVTIIGQDS